MIDPNLKGHCTALRHNPSDMSGLPMLKSVFILPIMLNVDKRHFKDAILQNPIAWLHFCGCNDVVR